MSSSHKKPDRRGDNRPQLHRPPPRLTACHRGRHLLLLPTTQHRPPFRNQLHFGPSTTSGPPPTPTRRPTRHINTTKKMKEWCPTARMKHLIIGDSNLARIPPFQHPDLQIDSFPGATFRHAEAILGRTSVTTTVQKVILAFGLNNRAQKPEQTTVKRVQRAMRMAKLAFPQAQILVPEINFSRALPHREQDNLRKLNINKQLQLHPRTAQEALHHRKRRHTLEP